MIRFFSSLKLALITDRSHELNGACTVDVSENNSPRVKSTIFGWEFVILLLAKVPFRSDKTPGSLKGGVSIKRNHVTQI